MTRSDLFDITSIPGIEDLTRAGRVAPDPAALSRARARLDVAIAAETDSSATVIGISGQAGRATRRRWVGRSLAVAAALALLPLGRIALDTADPEGAQVAIAADGSLRCSGGGYATAIDPRDADLRLLPATLPDGWALDTIAARWEASDDPASCRVPALTLLRTDHRVVSGAVSVYGPFAGVDAESFIGARSTVQVGDVDGLLLDSGNDKFLRWVWTDDDATWVMEAQGLSRTQGATLARAISTDSTSAGWQPTGDDLGLRVVAQRSGPRPTYRPAELAWYVDLVGPGGQSAHYTVAFQPQHPALALEAAGLGVHVSDDGTELRDSRPDSDQLTIWRDGLTISAGPGAQFTEGSDPRSWDVPFPTIESIVDSLVPVAADDPRLTEHALDEDTEQHP